MTAEAGETIRLDLNSPEFQKARFALEKSLQRQVLSTLKKLAAMTWDQIYRDPGLRWEAILSRVGPHGGRLYSLRISAEFRAVAFRDGSWLRLLTLHPDHNSAYR